MKKHTLLIIVILTLLSAGRGYAQFSDFEDDTSDSNNNSNNRRDTHEGYNLIDHLRFGGDFGIGFASGAFAVQFDPQVGYYFNQYVTAGIIATYEYYRYSSTYNSTTSSIYGGGIFAEGYPLDFLVVRAEAQAICYDNIYGNYTNYNNPDKKWDIPILFGGGYHKQLTDRAAVNMMLLWNINATKGLENNTSFSNPIIRVNFTF